MSQKYALPCACGSSVGVELRHAGGKTDCPQCSATLSVPKLRDLKRLDPVVDATPTQKGTNWSGLQGILFAIGLVLLAIAVGSGIYTYRFKAFYDGFTEHKQQDFDFSGIRDSSLGDSWELWKAYRDVQLETRPVPQHVEARKRVAEMNKWLTFFGALTTLGLVSIALSFVLRPNLFA